MSDPKRNANAQRLFLHLGAEVEAMAPAEIWEWNQLGNLVDAADRKLQRTATAYVEGDATQEQLVEAAEDLRTRWKHAVSRFTRTRIQAA